VKVYLPPLAERVGLHEVAFVVHMETMMDGLALDVGDKTCEID
jgi:hypothetical protein